MTLPVTEVIPETSVSGKIIVGDFYAEKVIHWHIRDKRRQKHLKMILDKQEAIEWMSKHSKEQPKVVMKGKRQIKLGDISGKV